MGHQKDLNFIREGFKDKTQRVENPLKSKTSLINPNQS